MGYKVRYKKPPFLKKSGFSLWLKYHSWQRNVNEQLSELNLNYLQTLLILTIHWHSDYAPSITQVQIANSLDIDPMLASISIRSLEKNGWLTRKKHPVDTRAKTLHLTAKSHRKLSKIESLLFSAPHPK